MYTFLFLLGCIVGGSIGYLVAALVYISGSEDDDADV